MIHLSVLKSDWLTTKSYWKDLEKLFVDSDDRKKADFLNRVVFESPGVKEIDSSNSNTTEIPSIDTISQIMKEIDNELIITGDRDNDDYKTEIETETSKTQVPKMDEKIQEFIMEPVEP